MWRGDWLGRELFGGGSDAVSWSGVAEFFSIKGLIFQGFWRFEDRGAVPKLAGSCRVDAVGGGGDGGLVFNQSWGHRFGVCAEFDVWMLLGGLSSADRVFFGDYLGAGFRLAVVAIAFAGVLTVLSASVLTSFGAILCAAVPGE